MSQNIITIIGWHEGARTIDATRAIREHCGVSLRAAKSAVERCLDGEVAELACYDRKAANALAAELTELGFEVRPG